MKVKELLPYEKYTLTTSLPVDEILKRISSKINKTYTGKIQHDTFIISPIVLGKKSIVPEIKGNAYLDSGQTYLNITVQLHRFVKIFLLIALGMIGMPCIMCITTWYKNFRSGVFTLPLPQPFLIIILGYVFVIVRFQIEAIASKKFLEELLEAHIADIS